MTAPRSLLVTGGTGFIGSAVLRSLAAHNPASSGGSSSPATGDGGAAFPGSGAGGPVSRSRIAPTRPRHVTALVRRFPEPGSGGWAPGVEFCAGDLTDPASLRGLCEGVDTLVHCASYIGSDAEACARVNDEGTRALLTEAGRAGVRRILYLSTTAVYGSGPHRGLAEDSLVPAPASPTSASRLAAERAVLDAGGTVLRPPFVHGPGDIWVVPAVAELLRRVPALPEDGSALLSLVAVEDLARLITTLALSADPLPGGAHHAGHPTPVTLRDFVARLVAETGLPAPRESLPAEEYLDRLRHTEGRVGERQARMLTADRWYHSPLWERLGVPAGPGLDRIAQHASWYRELLAPAAR